MFEPDKNWTAVLELRWIIDENGYNRKQNESARHAGFLWNATSLERYLFGKLPRWEQVTCGR